MSRRLRIEFAGALYHVTSRGDGQEDIYLNNIDRERFNWIPHAYCLMGSHYHLLLETPDSNLSKGMRQLNGVYAQRFNRKHKRVEGNTLTHEGKSPGYAGVAVEV